MEKVNLKEYLPDQYEGIVEAETQQEALSIEMNLLNDTVETAINDQFVQTASEKAIIYYENIFKIVANPVTETLQFRRDRVLNRMKSLCPPYTYWYMRNLFDSFFGVGKYTFEVDNDNYTISLESSANDSAWYHEIQVSTTLIKPANLIFINKPTITTQLYINETVSKQQMSFNYKLNGTWLLGLKPFVDLQEEEEVVKMPSVASIQDYTIEKSLNYLSTQIKKVKINDEVEMTDFSISVADFLIVSYNIVNESISSITNIKLLDEQDNVLFSSNVYIPIEGSVQVKHKIKLEEGVNE